MHPCMLGHVFVHFFPIQLENLHPASESGDLEQAAD